MESSPKVRDQGRKAAAVANWVHDILKTRKDAEFEIVDIEDYKPAPR